MSSLFVAVDASTKHDSTAVVALRWEGPRLVLVCHRIWRPSPEAPLDLEATVEAYLRDLHARGNVQVVVCDPFQLHRSMMTLKAAGLPIREYPQTSGNVTLMAQTLFDLLNGRNLRMYPSAELREQALNCVALDSPRGWKITKERARHKIDAIVALAMACVAAMDAEPDLVTVVLTNFGQSTPGNENFPPNLCGGSGDGDPLPALKRYHEAQRKAWVPTSF
jgi:hypothetical protein